MAKFSVYQDNFIKLSIRDLYYFHTYAKANSFLSLPIFLALLLTNVHRRRAVHYGGKRVAEL